MIFKSVTLFINKMSLKYIMQISDQVLNTLTNDFQTEVSIKINELKNLNVSREDEQTDLTKEISILNNILMQLIKLKCHKKKSKGK